MSKSHTLRRIGNKVTGNKAVLHTCVTHSDTVANSDSREYDRSTAAHSYTQLNGFNQLVDVHVSGNDLIVGRNDTNEWTLHFLFSHAKCIEK